MPATPDGPAPLPIVRMDAGLLLCPSCGSMDLATTLVDGVLACDDCNAECRRASDQCPQCGSLGVTQVEHVGFSAPGQSPKEAPRKVVRTCAACGYTNAGR